MSLIEQLRDESIWRAFLESKINGGHLSKKDQMELEKYINDKVYEPIVESILQGDEFPIPTMKRINKKNNQKKRTVYLFDDAENYVLKAIMFLLYKYDNLFTSNLYSFRRSISVKTAVDRIMKKNVKAMYGYKVDIHDYFNSIDTDIMIHILRNKIRDDDLLVSFISSILSQPKAYFDSDVIDCKKGIMAGVPISGFLANLYLEELDRWFYDRHILYARYSDDIIVFGETKELVDEYKNKINQFLSERKLNVNPDKEFEIRPGDKMDFLGFSFVNNQVDLSDVALQKMKDKMRRKARALLRWKAKKNVGSDKAIRAYIKYFDKKLFDNPNNNELTWCKWYFPIITTDRSLHILDEYMVQNIRYISTGKHTKANYNLTYDTIKSYGFRSLVNSYYKFDTDN